MKLGCPTATLYINNNENLSGSHAVRGFGKAGVETFSRGGEITDWNCQVSVILQEIRSAWWQTELLMSECLVSMIMSWIAEEHIWKNSSVNDTLFFNSALRKKRWSLTRFYIFTLWCFFKTIRWIWNEPLNKLPLAMQNTVWVFCGFHTHVVTGAGLGRKQ